MTNPSRDLSIIQGLVDHLESRGHEVPTRQVADPAAREGDSRIPNSELARRVLAWLSGCDALVAEVSAPSHGVGIQVATAVRLGTPSLLIYRVGLISSADVGIAVGTMFGGEMPADHQRTVSSAFPGRYASFVIGVYNGGGYAASEQNANKPLEDRAWVPPLPDTAPGLEVSTSA